MPKQDTSSTENIPAPTIVGIGASTGGLTALKKLFSLVPNHSGLAYVVVVHLAPEHKNALAELLQPHIKMPVRQVTKTIKLEGNHVYVVPPNANLGAIDTHLRLTELEENRKDRAPIDHFFRTLAQTHDGNSIGIILTGTGSDGALGIKEIKFRHGLTIVQDPDEAEYDGMPQSAIATGLVDVVLPLEEIPAYLLQYTANKPRLKSLEPGTEPDEEEHLLIQKIQAKVRSRTGQDYNRSSRKKVEEELRDAKIYAESIVETLHEPLIVLTKELKVRSANPAFYEHFKVKPEDSVGRIIYDLGNGQWDIPVLRKLLEDILPDNNIFLDFEVSHKFEDIGQRIMLLNARRLDHVQFILLGIRDITEKKAAEEALRQSEEKHRASLEQEIQERTAELNDQKDLLKATMDSSLDMIQVFEAVRDEKGAIVDFRWILNNHTSEKYYGNVIGKHLLKLNPGVVETGIFDTFKQVVETGVPDKSERYYALEQFNGWFYQSVVKLGDGVATTTMDISERKEAEQAVESGKEFLQSLIDSSLDIIQVFKAVRDEAGKIIDFTWMVNNKQAIEQNGEVIGQSLLQLNPGTVPSGIFGRMIQVVETGVPQEQEQYYDHEQFEKSWYYLAIVKHEDGVILTTRDISAQKKAEQELLQLKDDLAQRATEKYNELFNSIDQGFCTIAVKYDETDNPVDYQFLEVNPSFEDHTGIKNAAGRRMRDIAPEQDELWFEKYGRVAKNRKDERFEYYSTPLGRWWSVYAFPIDDPELRRIGVLINDITDSKKEEERQTFLFQLTDAIRHLTDPVEIQATAARMLGEHLDADRVYYVEIKEDSRELVVARHWQRTGSSSHARHYPLSDWSMPWLSNGETWVLRDAKSDPALPDDQRESYLGNENRAAVVVPLIKNDRLEGTFVTNQREPRLWTKVEVSLVEETAERTWAAVERAKAEEEYRNSEAHLNAIFSNAEAGISEISPEGKFLRVNKKLCEILGRSNDDLLQLSIGDVTVPAYAASSEKALQQLYKTKVPCSINKVYLRPDGTEIWANSALSLVKGQYSGQEHVLAVTVDLTEIRKAEEAIRKSEERLQKALDIQTVGVIFFDLEGKIIDSNAAFQRMSGFTWEEIHQGKVSWDEVTPPEFMPVTNNSRKELQSRGENTPYEKQYIRPDGSRWWGLFSGKRLSENECVEFVLDITKSKAAEQALHQAKEEAERAAKAKEEFLSTMSHEIRTPLNAIIGLSNLLLKKNPRQEQIENLNTLKFSSHSLLKLINDILDYSKLEAGKVELEHVDFRLSTLIHSIRQSHLPLAEENSNELIFRVADNVPDILRNDPHKLAQVLNNLISNAVKFTENGRISLEVKLENQIDNYVWLHFAVRDTGVGISEEKRSTIFDKFTQADSSTVRRFGGTGLGLSITKSLLQLMNSDIHVESRLGEGSLFYFTLRQELGSEASLRQDDNSISSATVAQKRIKSPINLLLVDDSPFNRMVLQQHLEDWWNLKADEATNGLEAIEKARQVNYDLILMDIRMPEMDGLEASRRIRSFQEHYVNIPIIALTADTTLAREHEGDGKLLNGIITKPFEPEQLKKIILPFVLEEDDAPTEDNQNALVPVINEDIYTEGISSPDFTKIEQVFGSMEKDLNGFYLTSIASIQQFQENFKHALQQRDAEELENVMHKAKMLFNMFGLDDFYAQMQGVRNQIESGASSEYLEAAIFATDHHMQGLIGILQNKVKE